MNEHIFRAYDIRGVFNESLTPELLLEIGQAAGTYWGGKGTVVIGKDGRTSSELVEHALIAGLLSTGCDVVSITGVLPIPVVNFKIMRTDPKAGIMITASHNPPEYNGVRFRHPDGCGYTKGNEDIKKIFDGKKYLKKSWDSIGRVTCISGENVAHEYVDHLVARVKLGRKIRVVVDCENGAAGTVAPYLFRRAGCEVITLNAQPDGTFPGGVPEPKGHLRALEKLVVGTGADFGVAYDGDADRAVFVDDKGREIQSEKIGVIVARGILKEKKGPVIANAPCSMIVEEELGDIVVRTRVGDVFIGEAVKECKAVFGMEISSHYFLPTIFPFDDGILMSLMVAQVACREKLSGLADAIPSYPFAEERVKCADDKKFGAVEELKKALEKEGVKLSLIDGVKAIYPDGWILARASNTEPIIKLFAEAKSEKRVEELVKDFKERMSKV